MSLLATDWLSLSAWPAARVQVRRHDKHSPFHEPSGFGKAKHRVAIQEQGSHGKAGPRWGHVTETAPVIHVDGNGHAHYFHHHTLILLRLFHRHAK